MNGITIVIIVIAAVLLVLYIKDDGRQYPRPIEGLIEDGQGSIVESLSGSQNTEGFKRAVDKRVFQFPEDAGPHPGFQTEWWYYTGNLSTREGRHFGFHLTFFRRSLAPGEMVEKTGWRTNNIYFAHFALTDSAGDEFFYDEQWARAAIYLAGAKAFPFGVWVGSWRAESMGESTKLIASTEEVGIDLILKPMKPPVLNGDDGLSRKSVESGNASYYYSITRLQTAGTLRIGGHDYAVSGLSWLDREWSTSALSPKQEGWDWFSLQLDDGRELMLYQIRLKDGGIGPYSAGTLVERDGSRIVLKAGDFQIEPKKWWKSPKSGVTYPSRWRLSVPDHVLELTVVPKINKQELNLSFVYWEGAVEVRGDGVSGLGYVELTGY